MVDFKNWLVGTSNQPGFLQTLDLPYKKKDFSEETLRLFVHRIVFRHDSSGFGCFSDEHESPENKADRTERYLPQYLEYFNAGITHFEYQGQLVGVDDRIVDLQGNDLIEARVTPHKVTNADGLTAAALALEYNQRAAHAMIMEWHNATPSHRARLVAGGPSGQVRTDRYPLSVAV